MKKNNSKKKYDHKKKQKKILKFFRNNAAVITIFITILAAIMNGILAYYRKSCATEFYFQYLTVNVDRDDWVKTYQNLESNSYFLDMLKSPTVNNEINQLLYQNSDKAVGYFITYLIIQQRKEIDALDVKIHFKQYGQAESLEKKSLEEFPIDEKQVRNTETKIEYPFPKDEQVKIPISICKTESDYNTNLKDCYYTKLEATSIEYRNKYLFSKRNVPIRKYLEKNVIIDGQLVTGKGGTALDETEQKWYLKQG